jgi:hypothetical protein
VRTVQVIVQFLSIWDLVRAVRLSPVPDRFVWKWSPNGIYSSSSAYAALLLGRVDILGACQIWKTQMPGKCKFFAWLVLHGRCWTSDRLHCHGLKDSDSCALCAQEVETLDHLLVDCVFSRETWFRTLGHILLPLLAPDRPMSLAAWWCSARKSVAKTWCKGFNAFVWLVAWSIWRQRNRHVHDREALMPVALVPAILDEARTWARVGFLLIARLLEVRHLGPLSRFPSFSCCLLFLCNLLNLV